MSEGGIILDFAVRGGGRFGCPGMSEGRGGGSFSISSMGEVWIFSGMTNYDGSG